MSTKPQRSERLEFIDALRGYAVLSMLVLHTAHGWLRPDVRSGTFWYWINSIGGMAAPLFFLLLGVGFGLRRGSARAAAARREAARGLSLVVLGYLLRVQMWQFDGAALVDPLQLVVGLLLASGYLSLYVGVERWGRERTDRRPWKRYLLAGLIATPCGLWAAAQVAGRHWPNLLRFDVLQGLGVAALIASPLAALPPRVRGLGLALLGTLVLVATPWLRAWVPGPLPAYLAAPIAFWPPTEGGAPWAMFPVFPWVAYALFGGLVGAYLRHGQARGLGQGRLVVPLVLMGAGLAYLTSEDLARVTDTLARYPALTQPNRVGYRFGIGLVGLGLALATLRAGRLPGMGPVVRALVALGRASLWVYWVHLEFAFGAPSTPIHARLTPEAWGALLALLTLSMVGLAHARGWLRTRPASTGTRAPGGLARNVKQGA